LANRNPLKDLAAQNPRGAQPAHRIAGACKSKFDEFYRRKLEKDTICN
jgi:hypothetical protein